MADRTLDVTLTGDGDAHLSGCGWGMTWCSATLTEIHRDGTESEVGSCKTAHWAELELSCTVTLYGAHYAAMVENPLTDSYVADYRACNGDGTGCVTTEVEWTPWPMDLKVKGLPRDSDGILRALVSNEKGFPPVGEVSLRDLNKNKPIFAQEQDAEGVVFALPEDCPGPYFRADYYSATSAITRINGIDRNSELCHNDPDDNDTGNEGDGGTGGGPPSPPTAILEGPTSARIPAAAQVTVKASKATEYPYGFDVLNADTGEHVYGCSASKACTFEIAAPDEAARNDQTVRLIAHTVFNGAKVADGDEHSVTFEPYLAQPKIRVQSLSPDGQTDRRQGCGSGTPTAPKSLRTRCRWPSSTAAQIRRSPRTTAPAPTAPSPSTSLETPRHESREKSNSATNSSPRAERS